MWFQILYWEKIGLLNNSNRRAVLSSRLYVDESLPSVFSVPVNRSTDGECNLV